MVQETTAPQMTQWHGGDDEQAFLGTLSLDAPWGLVEEFRDYVRESGTEGEAQAVAAITRRLTEWGVPHHRASPALLDQPAAWRHGDGDAD